MDDISHLGTDSTSPQQTPIPTAGAIFNLTTEVATTWERDFIHGDPLRQRIVDDFHKEAESVDALVTQVFTLEEESRNAAASVNSITSHYRKMSEDYAEAQLQIRAAHEFYAEARAKIQQYSQSV